MLNFICDAWLSFENDFIVWLQSLGGTDTPQGFILANLSVFGEEIALIVVIAVLYFGIDKKIGERIGFYVFSSSLINPLIKNIVRRTRPFNSTDNNGLIKNLRDVDGYSFPSGHSSGSASAFTGTAYEYRKQNKVWLWAIGIAIPLFVALSRNYCGAHYFTDVVLGLAQGVLGIVFFDKLLSVVKNKYYVYIGLLIVGFAGFFYCTTDDFFTTYGMLLGFTAGVFFEEKITKFDTTKTWWRVLLRLIGAGAFYLGFNALIKLPFASLCEQSIWFSRIFRVVRYAIILFVLIGVYPLLFKQCDKLYKKWGWIK